MSADPSVTIQYPYYPIGTYRWCEQDGVETVSVEAVKRAVKSRMGDLLQSVGHLANVAPRPSFHERYLMQRKIYQGALDLAQRDWGALWDWETKQGVRAVANVASVETPEVYCENVDIQDLAFHSFPDVFVIKPIRGFSRNGVYVLKRKGAQFQDLLRNGKLVSEEEVRSEISALGRRGLVSSEAMTVERAILEGARLPYDWKVYSFQGETPLVLQISRNGGQKRASYYDGTWRRLGQARYRKEFDNDLPLPLNADELLRISSVVSKLVPVPFVRVDLYEMSDAVYLGELTPMPGSSQRFRLDMDQAMGNSWIRAESKLMSQSASLE